MESNLENQLLQIQNLRAQIETYIIEQRISNEAKVEISGYGDIITVDFLFCGVFYPEIKISLSACLNNGFEITFETALTNKFDEILKAGLCHIVNDYPNMRKEFIFLVQRYKPKYEHIKYTFKRLVTYDWNRAIVYDGTKKISTYNQAIKNGNEELAKLIYLSLEKHQLEQCDYHIQYFNVLYELQAILPSYNEHIRDILLLLHDDGFLFNKNLPYPRAKRLDYYLHHNDPVFRNLLFNLFKNQIYTAITMIKQYILDDLVHLVTYLYLYSFCMQ